MTEEPNQEPLENLHSWDTMHEHEYVLLDPSNANGLADVGCTRCGHGLQVDPAKVKVEAGKLVDL